MWIKLKRKYKTYEEKKQKNGKKERMKRGYQDVQENQIIKSKE
jgi:hypothetical protein